MPSRTTGQDDQQADEDGEVVITIGDEAPPAADDEIEGKPAPQWVRDLRKEAKEAKKRVRELEQAEAARQATAAPKADPVGDAPTLESCDYDAEKYADAKLAWSERKRAADAKAAAERQQQEAAQAEWAKMQDDYRAAGSALKLVGGFDDAEATVKAALDPMQHAILVQGPKTVKAAAQLVGALSRNPASPSTRCSKASRTAWSSPSCSASSNGRRGHRRTQRQHRLAPDALHRAVVHRHRPVANFAATTRSCRCRPRCRTATRCR
jgi:hypothetical protein